MQGSDVTGGQESVRLLRSVAEQLTLPLSAIARQAELGELTGNRELVDLAAIHTHATAALTLVESYLLGLQLMHEQAALALEPVSISSTLVDIAHQLEDFAKQYGAFLELEVAGKYEPVMAHRQGLVSALLALGYTLLESGSSQKPVRLTLAVHRTPHGIVTGLYGEYEHLKTSEWRRALKLQGQARQPFGALCQGSGAGLFVADTILQAMATRLRVGKHHNQYGLATTLQPSQQLQFV